MFPYYFDLPRLMRKSPLIFLSILGLMFFAPQHTARAATILVNSAADNTIAGNGLCTLREAIANANGDTDTTSGDCVAGAGTDTIHFSSTIRGQPIVLAGSALIISSNLTIDAGMPGHTIDGNNGSQIFRVNVGAVVTMNHLLLTGGNVVGGGGAITNLGNLTITDSLLTNNAGTTIGGAISNGNTGTLSLNRTTVSNNAIVTTSNRTQGSGAGIYNNQGTVILVNATITGNSVSGVAPQNIGGGVSNNDGVMYINSSTIVNNTAAFRGGGISNSGTLEIRNSIVANNTSPTSPDCFGSITAAYTLVEATSNCTLSGANNLTGVDPLLGSLDAYGGGSTDLPIYTHVPLDSSPVLDAGNPANCQDHAGNPVTEDQRSLVRPVDLGGGSRCDLGAFERQANEETDQQCAWTQGVPHVFGTDVHVTITPTTADNPGCVTVLKRSVFAGGTQDDGEFPIIWTLSAENSPFNLDVQFCYTDLELVTAGVTDETGIVIYHLTGGTWQPQTTVTDPANNCVTVSGVTSLSPWTLVGNGNAPTAIELQNLTARAVTSTQTLGLVLVALLGLMMGVWLLRSKAMS